MNEELLNAALVDLCVERMARIEADHSTFRQDEMRPADLAELKQTKGGTWYDEWRPYCVARGCARMPRMSRKPFGFECPDCGNQIDWRLHRITHPK